MTDRDGSAPILALDLGSTAVKAGRSTAGGVLRGDVVSIRHRRDAAEGEPGHVDPHRVVEAARAALGRLDLAEVEVVATSSVWHALVAVDERSRPLGPALTWEAVLPASMHDELARRLDGAWSHRSSGAYLHPSYAVAALPELLRRRPARVLDLASWVVGQLAGVEACWPENIAAASGLWLARARRWNAAVLERLGVDEGMLGPVWVGPLDGDASPVPELRGARWLPPLGDGMCHNLGEAAIDGRVAVTVGTSGSVRSIVTGGEVEGPGDGLWRYRVDDEVVVTGGAVTSAGNVLEWVERELGPVPWDAVEPARLAALPKADPAVFGRRGPDYPWDAHGAVTGIGPATTRADLALAFGVDVWRPFAGHLAALRRALQVPVTDVVAAGGVLSNRPESAQLLADALGVPVHRTAQDQPALAGAALVAGVELAGGRGIRDTVAAIRARPPAAAEIVATVRPRPEITAALAERWSDH